MKMLSLRTLVGLLLLLLLSILGKAQEAPIPITLDSINWQTSSPAQLIFDTVEGRKTMHLNGKIYAKGIMLSNGSIEVDIYATQKRSFAGIIFRHEGEHAEEVYLRMHKSRQVDALQYTPIFNAESNWQLYREYQAQIPLKLAGWNTLKVEIHDDQATIFVNNDQVLVIDDLKTNNHQGQIGLFSLFGATFSNFSYKPSGAFSTNAPQSLSSPSDSNIVGSWLLSEAFDYSDKNFGHDKLGNLSLTEVSTEPSGLLPISRYVKKSSAGSFERNRESYVVASKTIDVEGAQNKIFSFDYSDKIIIYLNGQKIFKGNNAFRAKGPQYQGHLDLDANQLFLELKPGRNTLECVIIEKANGWGLMGKIE